MRLHRQGARLGKDDLTGIRYGLKVALGANLKRGHTPRTDDRGLALLGERRHGGRKGKRKDCDLTLHRHVLSFPSLSWWIATGSRILMEFAAV